MAFNEPSVTQLLPNTGLLSLRQIVGDKTKGIQGLIPISRSGWLQGCREKRFPTGLIVGKRRRLWTSESIAAFIADLASEGGSK
jgi:prophage regulatory protein